MEDGSASITSVWKNSDESEEPELPASGADQWNEKFLPGYTGEEPPYDPEWEAHLKTFSPGDRLLHQPRTEEDDPIGEAYPVIYKSPDQNYLGAHWVHNPASGQTEWTFRNSLMPYGDINDLPTYQGNYETDPSGKRVWNPSWEGYNPGGNSDGANLQVMLEAIQREEARNKETGEPFNLTNVFMDVIPRFHPGTKKEKLVDLFNRAYQLGQTPIRGEGNDPDAFTLDEGHNIVYPEGQAEQMGFHDAPAEVQMKTPGWGGYTAPPWGPMNADGSFNCQNCHQRTKFDDWNDVVPNKGGTLPCSHCDYPLSGGYFPRTDSHPGYVHDPRFPGYQRWTNNATFECPCWYALNEPMKHSEPDPNCPKCHGSGTVVVPHNPHTDGSNGQFRLDPRFDLVQPPAQGFGEERYGAAEEGDDELHVGLAIPERIQKKIKAWCDSQDWPKGTELEDPSDYHITLLYISEGHEENQDSDWIRHTEGYEVKVVGIDEFGDEPDSKATVLRIESDDVIDHANDLQDAAENRGLPLKRFPGGYKAHLTVAYGPGKPKYARTPDLKFQTGASSVSTPRAKKEANTPQIAANEGYSPVLDFLHAPETRDAPTQGVQQPSRSGGHRGAGDERDAFGPTGSSRRRSIRSRRPRSRPTARARRRSGSGATSAACRSRSACPTHGRSRATSAPTGSAQIRCSASATSRRMATGLGRRLGSDRR
jgi:2'-5' RNA ligase